MFSDNDIVFVGCVDSGNKIRTIENCEKFKEIINLENETFTPLK